MAADDSTVTKDTAVGSGGLERFSYDDKIVRAFRAGIVLWGIVAFLVGIIVALATWRCRR